MIVRGEEGWSLIELICTLSLLSVMTTIAYPQLIPFSKQMEEELFVKLWVDELYYARAQAISYEQDITVHWQAHQLIVRKGDQTLRRLKIPSHLQITSNFPHDRLTYRSSGQAVGGTFQLHRDGKCIAKIAVQVASGIPKVIEPC